MHRIAELRREKNLSQTGLAMRLNVSQKAVSAYENGTHQPSIDTLKKMSAIFNVSVDYIIGNSDVRTSYNALSEEERSTAELLDIFRRLDKNGRQRAIGVLLAVEKLL